VRNGAAASPVHAYTPLAGENTPSRGKILGKSKVADFEVALGVEEQVLGLQVSVYYAPVVQVL